MTYRLKLTERMEQIYIIFLLGVIPLVVTPGLNEQYFMGKVMVAGIITLIMVILKGPELVEGPAKLEVTLLTVLVVITVISTVFSIDVPVSIIGSETAPEGLMILFICYGVFMVTRTYKVVQTRTIVIGLWLSAVVAVIALVEYSGLTNFIITYFHGYVVSRNDFSTIGNRNFIGTFSVLLIPTVLGMIIYYRSYKSSFVLALLVGLMVISQTRSAYIAFGVILLLFLRLTLHNQQHFLRTVIIMMVMVGILIGGVYLLTFILKDYRVAHRLLSLAREILGIFSGITGNMGSYRVAIWGALLPEVLTYFWYGSGPDTVDAVAREIGHLGIQNLYYQKAHNQWLQMALTQGVPYLLVYIAFVGTCLKKLMDQTNSNFWARVIIITIVAYEMQGMFSISVPGNNFIYWAFLGLGSSQMVIKT